MPASKKKPNNKSKLIKLFIIAAALPFGVLAVMSQTSFFNKAFFTLKGTNANLVVNLTNYSSYDPPWTYYSQGGEEPDGMLGDVVEPMTKLRPKYIRIDHVFDHYDTVSRSSDGKLTFNWQKLDSEISAIRKTGALPFISLSYMPAVISSGSEVDLPVNWKDWQDSVTALIEHISGRGQLGISNVYYEVWNEPDLFGGFKLSGRKNYLELYKYSSSGAGAAKNTLPYKFGGPATTGLYRSWFYDLMKYVERNNLRLDFYSWHRYSKFISDFENDITTAGSWLTSFPRHSKTELLITETGYNSENDPGNDSVISAIQAISMYQTLFQRNTKAFVFEVKDGPGPEKYYGRWGILTSEKFGPPEAKPKYRAMEILNRLDKNFYPVYGQGSWVKATATTDGSRIRILLSNYDPFWTHTETFPLTLVKLPDKNFILRKTEFMGKTTEENMNLTEETFKTSVTLKPNTAILMEIIPQ